MNCLKNIVRNFSHIRHFENVSLTKHWSNSGFSRRCIGLSLCSQIKTYKEHENSFAYNLMENRGYIMRLSDAQKNSSPADFNLPLYVNKDWYSKSPEDIILAFQDVSKYASENNICISNKIFDKLIDALTDNMKSFSDEQLKLVFLSLGLWPETDSVKTRNYIEVWAALDDECLHRMNKWSVDEMLLYVSFMYSENIVRFSDYCHKCLQRLTIKYKHLTASQLVQTLFYIGVQRKSPFHMHNLEIHMDSLFNELSVDELAIMSMGFFKSQTPIRNRNLIYKIVEKVIDHSDEIHEVSLTALLKLIRYSLKTISNDEVCRLLNALEPQIPRLSVMCCVHIALLGTGTMTFHAPSLNSVSEVIFNNIKKTRLKDLERIVFAFGNFNFVPKLGNLFYQRILEELRDVERDREFKNHGVAYASCIHYLSMFEIYPIDLIDKVLSTEFLTNTYGKQLYNCGKEILALNNISEIFCSNSRKSYLDQKIVKFLAKRFTDYVPSEDYKCSFNTTEKFMLEIMRLLRQCRGGKDYVSGDHILSHHQRGDIIVCNNESGSPAPVSEFFPSKDFGLIQRPPNKNVWITLIISGKNTMIRDSHTANGVINAKFRELKALGYYPAIVLWSQWLTLNTEEEKCDYLNRLINDAIKNVSH